MENKGAMAQATPQGAALAAFYDGLDVSGRTREAYMKNLGYFCQWAEAEGLGLDSVRPSDIARYRDAVTETRSAGTARAYLTPVRLFYKWTASNGIYPDVTATLKAPKQPKGFRKDALSKDQARRTLEASGEAEGLEGMRDRAIVSLLMRSGLRTIEAARADVADLKTLGGRRVLWIQGKGRDSKDEYIVLTDAAAADLDAYLAARRAKDSEPLFTSIGNRNQGGRMSTRTISRICKESMKRAGIDSERLTAHSFRHTAITAALLGGATIQEAQAMARHSSINTTMIYSHNLERLERPAELAADGYFND